MEMIDVRQAEKNAFEKDRVRIQLGISTEIDIFILIKKQS